MSEAFQRFVRVMSRGLIVTDNLVNIRNGKVIAAITTIKNALDAASIEGVGVKSLQEDHTNLESARAKAMLLNDNEAKCNALDPIKTQARDKAKTATSRSKDAVTGAKKLLTKLQMADAWCLKFAKYVKEGLPKTGKEEKQAEDPNLDYLDGPSTETPKLTKRLRLLIATDSEQAVKDWSEQGVPYENALSKFAKEVLNPPLLKKVNDLIEKNPKGPEAKMQEALGKETFEKRLFQVVQTAEAFGVNNDKLSPGEQVALFTYTAVEYRQMNRSLLEPKRKTPDLDIMCSQTISALAKLDSYVGESTRGEGEWVGADEQYVKNNIFTVKAFWSSSIGFAFDKKYQITISGKTGKDVAGVSNSPHEAEILFAPGTKFRVADRVDELERVVKIRVEEV